MSVGVIAGNTRAAGVIEVTLSPASVAANTTAEQLFTVNGLSLTPTPDWVYVNKPTAQAGLGIVGARVSAANQIGIVFSNNTAAAIVPTASQVYTVRWARPDGPAAISVVS